MEHPGEQGGDLDLLIDLVQDFSAGFTAAADEALGTISLENAQFLVLSALADRRPHAIADLVTVAHMDRRRLMTFLHHVEAEGVIELGTDQADHLRRVARLTPRGAARMRAAESRFAAFFEGALPLAAEIARLTEPSATPGPGLSGEGEAPASAFDLAEQVVRAGMALQLCVRQILGEQGWERVRGQGLLALVTVARHGTCRPGTLVSELRLTPGGVTYVLGSLEDLGLLERRRDVEGDRRGVTVTLTADGRVAADAYRAAVARTSPALYARFSTIAAAAVAS